MSWWLIVLAIIVALLIIALVIYLVVILGATEEENNTWLPKIIIILSFSFACYNVFLLPYDIANVRESTYNSGGNINVTALWIFILVGIFILCFLVCPFALMFYEFMDPDKTGIWQQIKPAIIVTAGFVGVFLTLLFLCWGTLGYSSIVYVKYEALGTPAKSFDAVKDFVDSSQTATIRFKVSLFVYFVAFLSAIGWMFFFLFGGVGLAAIPIDCLRLFWDRPRPITATEYSLRRAEIAQESQRLLSEGKRLEEDEKAGYSGRRQFEKALAFKQRVRELEAYYNKIEHSYNKRANGVLRSYFCLFLGIVFASMSLMWALQMVVHNMAQVYPLLSNMFIGLDKAFALFGVLAYCCFSFYLLCCTVKGCITLGGNLLLFQIYIMEVNGTLISSFLFNAMLIMVTSTTVLQFCAVSFSEYAVNTSVSAVFTACIANLDGIKYLVTYMQYPLLVIAGISVFWLLICPRRCVDDD